MIKMKNDGGGGYTDFIGLKKERAHTRNHAFARSKSMFENVDLNCTQSLPFNSQ